jgi:hypothetical protein
VEKKKKRDEDEDITNRENSLDEDKSPGDGN